MKKIDLSKLFTAIFSSFLFLFFLGCAGTKDDTESGSDVYFADESGALVTESSDQKADDDEVLRLLGLSGSGSDTGEATKDMSVQDLEAQISSLQRDVEEKNAQVANLRAELAERDQHLQALNEESSTTITSYGSSSAVSSDGSFKGRYDAALSSYNNRQYRQAIQQFNALLADGSNKGLLDNCQYWKGECYYGLHEYHQAIIEFEKVFAYSNSNKEDAAQLKLGLCYVQLDNMPKATVEFQKLIDNYPNSEFIPKAKAYLSR